MGVDVYGYVEVHSSGQWAFAAGTVDNPERANDPDEPAVMPEPLFHSYQKELAAILTDTGNPIRSSEPYIPVVPRRGLPPDMSPVLSAWFMRDEDASSSGATWFTAREAVEFGWADRIMRRRAHVPTQAAPLFADCPRGFPWTRWPAGVPVSYAAWSRDGIEVEWLESYEEIVPTFARDVLPQLAAFGPLDQVRLIVLASW